MSGSLLNLLCLLLMRIVNFEYLAVNTNAQFFTSTGDPIPKKDRLKYLGSLLSNDARVGAELNHRLGAARAEYDKLHKIWAHSKLSIRRKHQIFQTCVVTKLLYSLQTAWLNTAELNKLDAFQARCLRKVTGIAHSYWSRVPNQTVRETAGATRLSHALHKQQLIYLGDIARKPSGNVLRDTIFQPLSFDLVQPSGPRRRGRPRNTWAGKLYSEAITAAGGKQCLINVWSQTPNAKSAWHKVVTEHCKIYR